MNTFIGGVPYRPRAVRLEQPRGIFPHMDTSLRRSFAFLALMTLAAHAALAQVAPAAGSTPPDDTPTFRTGVTFFGDYTYQATPTIKDADGNLVKSNGFNIGRSYINFTGTVSHIVAFRITPDIVRETGAGSSVNGSYVFRIKYAYAQFNLDDWMTAGSWARLGVQETPWVVFEENIYRYRFQGTVMADREGYLSSSDAGASWHYNLPQNFGDLHVGVYNGETFTKFEANDTKAFQVRFTVRPLAQKTPAARGLRLTVFYDGDSYLQNAEKKRFLASATFEHKYVVAAFEYLDTRDQNASATIASVTGQGYSFWVTPRSSIGVEGLFRYDQMTPNDQQDTQQRKRLIAGVAYWFPHTAGPQAALLVDYELVNFNDFTPAQPRQRRIAVHGLVNF
jgi:hypothetical protein